MGETGRRLAVVVEADPDVADLVRAILVRSDFDVVLARTGVEGVEAVRSHDPVLTTLDVDLPDLDGHAAARMIRSFSSTHVLLLADSPDCVDLGVHADAVVDGVAVKPVRPRTFRAAVSEVLQRPLQHPTGVRGGAGSMSLDNPWGHPGSHGGSTLVHPSERPHAVRTTPSHEPDEVEGWVRADGLAIDVDDRSVEVDGRPVDLSRTEFDLLVTLVATGRRVRSKADLVLTLRGQSYVATYFVNEADKRAIEVHLANIRRKLGDVGPRPRWIETVRGVGYRMADG